jgi:hypothetical protein
VDLHARRCHLPRSRIAALLVKIIQSRVPNMVIGLAIGDYVVREAIEIRTMASKAGVLQLVNDDL